MTKTPQPKCSIDHAILNAETLPDMKDIALSFFASVCGKNRGAFVLNPPDGNTYGCLKLPENIVELAGATDVDPSVVVLDSANSIKEQYDGSNITATDTVKLLNFLVQSVYDTTPNKASTPYACEIGGLAKLHCGSEISKSPRTSDGEPIRSAALAGLFVPASWATSGKTLSLKQAKTFYTLADFKEMKTLGLNTVQIAVPSSAFVPTNMTGTGIKHILDGILADVESAGLKAILSLVATGDKVDAIVSAGNYTSSKKSAVLGLELPPKMLVDVKTTIEAIRVHAPFCPLFVPVEEVDLITMNLDFDDNVYASLHTSHSKSVADVASSNSQEDRSKLFYHEATACIARSPLEYASCFKKTPIFVSSGFDLAIDDCIFKNTESNFKDYGQCGRFDETTSSGWWHRHRQSLAARQLFAFEQGLGWSFAAWKLYGEEAKAGVIDEPAKLMSLKDVAAAGLFPDLTKAVPAHSACLNPPESDFVLGDDTVAPTMGPPPDCGNGWWNSTTSQCDYWIPPPDPTPAPTLACPICDDCEPWYGVGNSATALATTGVLSSLATLFFVFIYSKTCGKSKKDEYQQIPH